MALSGNTTSELAPRVWPRNMQCLFLLDPSAQAVLAILVLSMRWISLDDCSASFPPVLHICLAACTHAQLLLFRWASTNFYVLPSGFGLQAGILEEGEVDEVIAKEFNPVRQVGLLLG